MATAGGMKVAMSTDASNKPGGFAGFQICVDRMQPDFFDNESRRRGITSVMMLVALAPASNCRSSDQTGRRSVPMHFPHPLRAQFLVVRFAVPYRIEAAADRISHQPRQTQGNR